MGAGSGNATHWVTADSNWRTWLLAGAGQADGNTQNSPLMGSLKEKVGQHPILESVLPSYKLICMSGFSSPKCQFFKHVIEVFQNQYNSYDIV